VTFISEEISDQGMAFRRSGDFQNDRILGFGNESEQQKLATLLFQVDEIRKLLKDIRCRLESVPISIGNSSRLDRFLLDRVQNKTPPILKFARSQRTDYRKVHKIEAYHGGGRGGEP
jgi:hypothetical protein